MNMITQIEKRSILRLKKKLMKKTIQSKKEIK